jgi:hypothetical protein
MPITEAKDVETGKAFQANEIADDHVYAQMRLCVLVDGGETIVVPVRRTDAWHFRRLGGQQKFTACKRASTTVEHGKAVAGLLDRLTEAKGDLRFVTYVFEHGNQGANGKEEQPIFKVLSKSEYRWYGENQIRFDDGKYIQPDISGRDIAKMGPGSANPGVIIEVIDTHPPEMETFEKLMSLSRSGYAVFFFLLKDTNPFFAQFYNSVKNLSPVTQIRFTCALLKGVLVVNGERILLKEKRVRKLINAEAHVKLIDKLKAFSIVP